MITYIELQIECFTFKNKVFLLPKKTGSPGISLTIRLIIRIIENVFFLVFVG